MMDSEGEYWKERCLKAENQRAVLQVRIGKLLTALNMIFVRGSPDEEAWQIALNALREKE